ncbi:MAG TPA: hypothetical protein VM674_01540 [Candidatus Acidoferrum sp.]|nr:hypothetical protein [Candidatus Acidoferrum sp.]
MALPRPAGSRLVFRPARRVSWGTRIFAILVLLVAIGAVGAFLEVFLPQQVAALSRTEANELYLAKQGTTQVNTATTSLWTDLSKGSVGLSDDQLAKDLTLAKQTEKTANDALIHVQTAKADITQAESMPFQFKRPLFITTDAPALSHMEKSLTAATTLAHGAGLQVAFSQSMNQNLRSLASLNSAIAARDWSTCTNVAAPLATAIKLQQAPAADPDTLLDPLWGAWVDSMHSMVQDAQQYCLSAEANQGQTAQQYAYLMNAARNQMNANYAAAQNDAAAWQSKTIKPLLDTVTKENAAAG